MQPKPITIISLAVLSLLTTIAGIRYTNIIQKQGDAPLGAKQVEAAQTFTPDPNSPLGKGEHPRLHITQDTLPYFQEKVATDYKNEYQEFVDWVEENFDQDTLSKAGLMADYHALIYLLGPIDGISYQHNILEYGDRAIEIMIMVMLTYLTISLIISIFMNIYNKSVQFKGNA